MCLYIRERQNQLRQSLAEYGPSKYSGFLSHNLAELVHRTLLNTLKHKLDERETRKIGVKCV